MYSRYCYDLRDLLQLLTSSSVKVLSLLLKHKLLLLLLVVPSSTSSPTQDNMTVAVQWGAAAAAIQLDCQIRVYWLHRSDVPVLGLVTKMLVQGPQSSVSFLVV